jgi:hypothetical protein
VALSDLELGFIHLNPNNGQNRTGALVGIGSPRPAFGAFVLPEVDAHSNGGLSFTPGEFPEGGGFPKCQFAPGGCLEKGTLISRRPGSTTILLWTWPIFLKMLFKKTKTTGQNPLQGQ